MIEIQKTCSHCGETFFVEHDLGTPIDFTGTCQKCIDNLFAKRTIVSCGLPAFGIDWVKLADSPYWKWR